MKHGTLVLAGILLIGLALVLTSCGQSDAKSGAADKATTVIAVPVKVQEVRLTVFEDAMQIAGTVKGLEDVMISPEEGGVIKEWRVQKGQPVKRGDILGVLNDDVIRASYEAASAQYKLAETNFQMQKNIYAEKAISELQFRSAEYNRDAAKAQADLAQARLDRTRLRSPIDGIFNDRFLDAGEFAPPAVPVAHVVNLFNLKVLAEISERYAGSIDVGSVVNIIPDAFPNDTLRGRIIFVGSTISANNRTCPIEIKISNPGLRLKPEMIVRAQVIRSVKKDAILLSENAVQLVDRDRLIVYVENNGKAEERVVRPGVRQGTLVEIVDGLKRGDRVIVTGIQSLVDGQPVSVVQ